MVFHARLPTFDSLFYEVNSSIVTVVPTRIKNWSIFAFIAGYHLLLVVLLPFYIMVFSWESFVLFFVTFVISGISITAGYHRLFSHKTYTAEPLYEWVILLVSALALQESALRWSNDHRFHHIHVDTEKDPYNIKRGFWYAHVWWLFTFNDPIDPRLVSDLTKNKRVMFQYKYYFLLAFGMNAAVLGIGCLFMHPIAALVGGVVLRVFAVHHCTWLINSLAHFWGCKTYSKELTAVDNAVLAFFTFGEGYHNYHHTMAHDYRNGIRWFHFDPTKWFIWTASKFGLASNLRSVNSIRVQQTLVSKDKHLLLEKISREIDDTSHEVRRKLEELSAVFEQKTAVLMDKLKELRETTKENRRPLLIETRQLKQELKDLWKSWLSLTQFTVQRYSIVH